MEEKIKCVGVFGHLGSQLATGIAQLAAVNGLQVWLYVADEVVISKVQQSISSGIQTIVSKGQLTEEKGDEALRNLNYTSRPEGLRSVDIVIDAANVESEGMKMKLFHDLDKVIGMHFVDSPDVTTLVEIVRTPSTSDNTFNATKRLAERLGKKVICCRDFPGFIVNRILMTMINEAFHALYTGVATKEDIDAGMKLGANYPMGPLELADHIGLDVCLSIMTVLHEGFRDGKYAPCPLLVQYVEDGRLGKRLFKGVYNYRNPALK